MNAPGETAASPELDWFEAYADRHQADAERTIATIPGLSLAVQAFLLAIGLGPNTSGAGRIAVIVGLVSAVITYAVTKRQDRRRVTYLQALHKHRQLRGAETITYDALREHYGATRDRHVRQSRSGSAWSPLSSWWTRSCPLPGFSQSRA